MNASKEIYITQLMADLEAGTDYSTSLANNAEKWRIAPRTFDRYWKTAKERHTAVLQERQNVLANLQTQADADRLKKAILTKDEALEILSKIVKGTGRKLGDENMFPSFGESISAGRLMAELSGWNAPIKQQTEITTGHLTQDQFETLRREAREAASNTGK